MPVWPRTSACACLLAFRPLVALIVFGLAGCETKPNIEVEFVDRASVFKSKSWKLNQAKADKFTAQLVNDAFKGQFADHQKWQLTVTVNQAEESPPRSDAKGKLPKDHVLRRLELTFRLRSLRLEKDISKPREYLIRYAHAENYAMLSSHQETLHRAVKGGIDLLNFEYVISNQSPEVLLGQLKSVSKKRRPFVLSEIRRRKLKSALQPLVDLLKQAHLDEASELEIIGALIAIGDQRAVGPLIDSVRRRSSIYLTQILFGVAELGGTQAEAYLFTLKAGHQSQSIRKHAADALDELNRRKRKEE